MSNTTLTDGLGTFNNTSACGGTVASAVFSNTAQLLATGVVVGDAILNDSATSAGTIQGDAYFTGTSDSTGTVQGDAYIAPTASCTGTVVGTRYVLDHSHGYASDTYWSNDATLIVGSKLYTGRYTMAPASGASFVDSADNTQVYCNALGVITSKPSIWPPNGTIVESGVTNTIYINELADSFSNGTYDVIADGSGGTSNSYHYLANGVDITTSGNNHYVSNGSGGYNEWLISGTVITSGVNNTTYISEVPTTASNGTYDVLADGVGGSTNGSVTGYVANGTELYNDGSTYHYVSNGSGGYTQYYRSGYVINAYQVHYNSIAGENRANGTCQLVADGAGSSSAINCTYIDAGDPIYDDGSVYHYVSNGTGGYDQYYRPTYIVSETNYIDILGTNYANGTKSREADGAGGYNTGYTYSYLPYGEIIATVGTEVYKSDGTGSSTHCTVIGTVVGSPVQMYSMIGGYSTENGYLDLIADGNCGTTEDATHPHYPAAGTELRTDGTTYHYVAKGDGSWDTWHILGYVESSSVTNYINIYGSDYSNGTYDIVANGSGGSNNSYTYAPSGTIFYTDGEGLSYKSNGVGGYYTE